MPPVGPNPSVNLRPATEQDVTFLTDVVLVTTHAQGRTSGEDVDGFREALAARTAEEVGGEDPHGATYVIEIDGERAGRMRLVRAPGVRELVGIQLLPAHQGHGLGTHLIEQFVVESRDQGLPVRTRIGADNPRARSLCERLGFRLVDETGDEHVLEHPADR